MKKHISTVLLVAVFFVGLAILVYPPVSNWWNASHQTREVETYMEMLSTIDDSAYQKLIADALQYNRELSSVGILWTMTEEQTQLYESQLNIPDTEVMGHIEIPRISCNLPIYHGTDSTVLQIGVGHIAGSSLPVGGEGSHCVLSGHRGLPSAKLFSDLNELEEGDHFIISILNETLTYEVDQIRIVEPDEVDVVAIEEGKDYCTLVTCTPYGINTHRLLVRGVRTENNKPVIHVATEAYEIDSLIMAPIVAVPILLVLLAVLLIKYRKQEEV